MLLGDRLVEPLAIGIVKTKLIVIAELVIILLQHQPPAPELPLVRRRFGADADRQTVEAVTPLFTEIFAQIGANGSKLPQQPLVGHSFRHVNLPVKQAAPPGDGVRFLAQYQAHRCRFNHSTISSSAWS